MKYKGFVILPEYHAGADFKVVNSVVIPRKPRKQDVAYYVIYDPLNGMKRWIAEDTVVECKKTIDEFLEKNNLKKNI